MSTLTSVNGGRASSGTAGQAKGWPVWVRRPRTTSGAARLHAAGWQPGLDRTDAAEDGEHHAERRVVVLPVSAACEQRRITPSGSRIGCEADRVAAGRSLTPA